jgi:hypothetical protein
MNFRQILAFDELNGTHTFSAIIPNLILGQGKYSLTVGLSGEEDGARISYFRYQSALYFSVHDNLHGWAPVQFTPVWKIKP